MRKLSFCALAVLAGAAQSASAVTDLHLTFPGSSTNVADTGFDNAYNPTPDPNPGGDRTGFYLGQPIGIAAPTNALNIWTQAGDTFGRYETDPDDAKNVFYSNFTPADRTTVTAHLLAQNLNNNFHGGGIWVGTDEDHYIRFGTIFNGNNTGADKANAEMLRENEDFWPPQGAGANPPFSGHFGDGNDIAGQQVVIPGTSLIGTAPNQYVNTVDITMQIILTGHTVRTQYSLDGGATWTPDNSVVPFFAGVATSPSDGATVEGGFKVGVYAFGGGSNNALLSFTDFSAHTVALAHVKWTAPAGGAGENTANWSEDVTLAATAVEGRTVELPTVGAGGHQTITTDVADLNAGTLIFSSPTGYTISGSKNVVINDGGINAQAGANEIATGLIMGGNARISGPIHVATGASLKLSGPTVPRVNALVVDGTGQFDLTNNSIEIDYLTSADDPIAYIESKIKSAYNRGSWNGPGITSSMASVDAGTTLAVYDTGIAPWAWQRKFGIHNVGTSGGSSPGDSTRDVLIMFTWIGDTNLDGVVNGADMSNMAPLGTTGAHWWQGDFNYDGVISSDDYALLNLGIALQHGVLAPVPEPALLAPLSLATLSLAVKRRPRRNAV